MVDVLIAAFALLAFVVVQRRPRPARLNATIVLALLAGLWIWANLRETAWQRDFGDQIPPAELDPFTRGMFYRGWPLSPCWFSLFHGMRFHADVLQPAALGFNWFILVVTLSLAKFACERRPEGPSSYDVPTRRGGAEDSDHLDDPTH